MAWGQTYFFKGSGAAAAGAIGADKTGGLPGAVAVGEDVGELQDEEFEIELDQTYFFKGSGEAAAGAIGTDKTSRSPRAIAAWEDTGELQDEEFEIKLDHVMRGD
ncbi:hypothetical protein RJT34_20490 [Clitoria ternatea]|uniref:Uncharacterized protein n=1 Tax=Clitoria ternatea TaxID=43366 RepID=A0AAN9P5U2_CLITE